FNALTTIGYLIQTAPPRALDTLLRLTSLLRAVLRSEGEFTTLGREIEVVEAYLDIERARFEQRLRVTIDVPAGLAPLRVPPLVLQPIVENAVKHGISRQRAGGEVTVTARIERRPQSPPELVLVVADTGAGVAADVLASGRRSGVGQGSGDAHRKGASGPCAPRLADAGTGRHRSRQDPEEVRHPADRLCDGLRRVRRTRVRGERRGLSAEAGREGAAARSLEPRAGANGARGNRCRAGIPRWRGGRGVRGRYP